MQCDTGYVAKMCVFLVALSSYWAFRSIKLCVYMCGGRCLRRIKLAKMTGEDKNEVGHCPQYSAPYTTVCVRAHKCTCNLLIWTHHR